MMDNKNEDQYEADFNVQAFLDDQGLEISNINEDGIYNVVDNEGNEGTFSPQEYLKAQAGLDPAKVKIQATTNPLNDDGSLNQEFNPIRKSPVGLGDRIKLDWGNEKGNIKYLKDKFEDVMAHPDYGLVVKNNGAWQQVDPDGKGVGDAYAYAQEFLADAGELVREATEVGAGIAGAALGTMVAPGAGTAAGSVAAAGLHKGGQVVLGKYLGTYEASDEEIGQELGIEMALSLAGEAIVPGGRVVSKLAKGAAKKVGKTAIGEATKNAFKAMKEMDGPARDALSAFSGFMAGAPRQAADDLVDYIDDVDMVAKKMINKVKGVKDLRGRAGRLSAENIDEVVGAEQIKNIKQAAQQFDSAVFGKFKQMEAQMINSADDFSANISEDIIKGLDSLTTSVDGTPNILKLADDGKYVVSNRQQIAEILLDTPGVQESNVGRAVMRDLDNVVQTINKYKDVGQLSGKDGAKAALEIRRSIDNMLYATKGQQSKAAQQLQSLLGQGFGDVRNNIVANFTKNPNSKIASLYTDMNKVFTENKEAIAMVKQIKNAKFAGEISEEAGLQKIYSQLTGSGQAANNFQRNWKQISKFYQGNNIKSGFEAVDRVRYTEAAKYYMTNFPSVHNLAGSAFIALQAGAGAGAMVLGEQTDNPMLTGAGALLAGSVSPRVNRSLNKLILNTPGYLKGMSKSTMIGAKNYINSLTPNQLKQLHAEPELMLRAITSGMNAEQVQAFQEYMDQ